MANHKSAIKAAAQSEKRKARNKTIRTGYKSSVKKAQEVLANKPADAREALREAESVVMKAVSKGIIKQNKGSRIVSNLTHKVKAAEGSNKS